MLMKDNQGQDRNTKNKVHRENLPLVSVILPCYNHEKYVSSCLLSIVNQTYNKIELILCDDCSTDNSFMIVEKLVDDLKKRFVNVIIEKNECNLGITKNLNKMIEKSSGTYIKCLATDDMLVPTAIEDMIEFAMKNPADVYFSNMYECDADYDYAEAMDRISSLSVHFKQKPKEGAHLSRDLLNYCFIPAPTALIPRETYKKFGTYDETLYLEDWEYWLRVSERGSFAYMEKCTVLYRISNMSMTRMNVISSAEAKQKTNARNRMLTAKMDVYRRYEKFSNATIATVFFNQLYYDAITFYDYPLCKTIIHEMRMKHISLSVKNILVSILIKTYLFYPIRRIANGHLKEVESVSTL